MKTLSKILTHWTIPFLTVFLITYLVLSNSWIVQTSKLKGFDYQLQNEEVYQDENLIYLTSCYCSLFQFRFRLKFGNLLHYSFIRLFNYLYLTFRLLTAGGCAVRGGAGGGQPRPRVPDDHDHDEHKSQAPLHFGD